MLCIDHSQDPAAFSGILVLSYRDLGLQAYQVRDAKLGRISLKIAVDDRGRDVLIGLDTKSLRVHREVWIFVGTEQIIALKARVQTVVRPCASE